VQVITVDGSYMEGGGQILRTALALSAVTREGVRINSVRVRRQRPGLAPQHLAVVNALTELTHARVQGNRVGSITVEFEPQEIDPAHLTFDIGTAGSATLFLHAILPVLLWRRGSYLVSVRGGTNVPRSPSVEHFEHAFLSNLSRFGPEFSVQVERRGFYPAGGGQVNVCVTCNGVKPLLFCERGSSLGSFAISGATLDLKKRRVAERQLEQVRAKEKHVHYFEATSTGSFVFIGERFTYVSVGVDSLGAPGKRAEHVGLEAQSLFDSQSCVLDEFTSDQIVPYLALYGGVAAVADTPHVRANVYVCSLFSLKRIKTRDLGHGCLLLQTDQ